MERQTIPFEQTTEYWLTRALKRRDAGDLRGAALLLRKAARQSPPGGDVHVLYAEVLRELGLCAASNREAFATLAADPSRFTLYGLIAENCSDMGLKRHAADAYSLFVAMGHALKPGFDAWDYDFMVEESYDEPPRRAARLRGLMSIAARRMGAGDLMGARRAFTRAVKLPLGEGKPMFNTLMSEFMRLMGDRRCSADCAWRVVRSKPDAVTGALAASVLSELGGGAKSRLRLALLYAAVNVSTDNDELAATSTLCSAGALKLLTGMLSRRLKQRPYLMTTNYNMALCMLMRGNIAAAASRAHLCRELDPEDVYAEALLDAVNGVSGKRAAAARAKELMPYGTITEKSVSAIALRLTRGAALDKQRAAEICADASLTTRLLKLMALGADVPALSELLRLCPPEYIEPLCREALMTIGMPDDSAGFALTMLKALGAAPPYTIVSGGHMLALDPDRPPFMDASFMQRRLTGLINQSAQYSLTGGYMPMVLQTISRMSDRQRLMMLRKSGDDWAIALAMRTACEHGVLAPIIEPFESLTRSKVKRLKECCERLRPRHAKRSKRNKREE